MTAAERLVASLDEVARLLPDRDRDIIAFDLETTGLDPATEAIIEISVARLTPSGETHAWETLLNPRREVSQEILALTGIRQADLDQAQDWDAARATVLAAGFAGCDFFGYNVKFFDLQFLHAKCEQVGVVLDYSSARILDAYVLWGKAEKRDLSAYVQRFAGREHVGAHRATADVAATAEGFAGFLRTFPNLPRDIQALHAMAFPREPNWIDADGKIAWLHGQPCINFGKKHKGRPLTSVRHDKGFLEWILNSNFPPDTKSIIRDFLYGGKLPLEPAIAPATDEAPF